MTKEILVTGGLGYIGSHTVVALVEAGFSPVILDNLSNTHPEVLQRVEDICGKKLPFYPTDITDIDALEAVFSQHQVQAVIHFAAFKAVGESVEKPLKYYKNNIGGLLSLLEVMEGKGVHNIVFSSSCTVYGEPDELPVTEQSPLKPATSPYGATKQMGEQILMDSSAKVIALRYFNPIGAHPSALIGEMPIGVPNNLVPYITQTAIGKRKQLTVNGNDYPTEDGTNVRDYIHVMDLAEAHVAAVNRQESSVSDFEVSNTWYLKHLGLIPTDVQCLPDGTPALAFNRLDLGERPADHHSLVVMQNLEPGYMHSAYETLDADAVGMGNQYLQAKGWQHFWGIGRHILGSQIFDYWLDPDGDELEHYADGDVFDASFETRYHFLDLGGLWAWGDDVPKAMRKGPPLTTVLHTVLKVMRGRFRKETLLGLKESMSFPARPWLK